MNIINLKDTSNKLFYVGGVVRDELLGIKSIDVDIVYEGNAIEYCSTLGEILQINPDFGTVRVKIGSDEIDFASTRTEYYEKKGHLPKIKNIGCSLRQDVMRRDFTINSLYKSLSTGQIFDFTGGLNDLHNKTIRVLHDKSFIDDPTRILRALKFSYRFGFKLDEHTEHLRNHYLKNINYDMCYKRIKKELIETLGLNSQKLFEEFIQCGIYHLVTPNNISLPSVNIETLIKTYAPNSEQIWLIYAGILEDLSRLELTKKEQKIINDFSSIKINNPCNDFEIYKTFENVEIESIILYAILKEEKVAKYYLDNLRNLTISVTGKTLQNLGINPSPQYRVIFDLLLQNKLANPHTTLEDEIQLVKKFIS